MRRRRLERSAQARAGRGLRAAGFALAILVAGLLPRPAPGGEAAADAAVIAVTIETAEGPRIVQAEVACTREQRGQGLMGRESLAPDAGMIFLLPVPRPMRMWMKDTPLALDLIFFDSNRKIIYIENNATPMSERVIESGGAVVGVLELEGGRAESLGISRDDKILYNYPQDRCE